MKKHDQADFRATGLFLSGFQSIAEPTFIPLKPLTFLYGPNSAGKSAVIDAIGLFDDIARRNKARIDEKVSRWQHRVLDDRRNWPPAGWGVGENTGGYSCLRVGVEFVVPEDWADHLNREVKDFKTFIGDTPQLDNLQALVGRVVHIDVGIWTAERPYAIRVAIDRSPIFEARMGEFDDGQYDDHDSSFRREGDEGYDVNNESDGESGPLRIYPDHVFWKDDYSIQNLSSFASGNDEPALANFVRKTNGHIDLYDVCCLSHAGMDELDMFTLVVGSDFFEAFNGSEPKSGPPLHTKGKKSLRKPPQRLDLRLLLERLEELNVLCIGLLQLGAASLNRVHVSGSRQVLAPVDTVLRDNFREDRTVDAVHPMSSYLEFARSLAYDETKSKKMARVLGFAWGVDPKKDHRVVNQWLQTMLPSLRGYKFRADAFETTPLARKRRGFGEIDQFVYRLYLTDAEGRPHEFEDVGSGVSYLLPILVSLWARTWSIIEQPELHLHPAAQCEIADVFIAGKNLGNAALIESHSENLLLRLLRRIRETTEGREQDESLRVSSEEVAVLYFEPQSNGTTKVKQLRISRAGDFIDRWPAGFFEERSKELFGE